MDIQEKFQTFLDAQKKIQELRKEQKELKKEADKLEAEIKDYMTKNEMDSISLKDGEIVLYDRKISQTFKRENLVEKIKDELQDEQKAEKLVESIVSNKVFLLEKKIKANIKKR
jgi:DNA repair ATPase RecN